MSTSSPGRCSRYSTTTTPCSSTARRRSGCSPSTASPRPRRSIVPLQCEALSHRGVGQLLETVEDVRQFANEKLRVLGVIPTMYDSRTNHARKVLAEVEERYGLPLFEPPVPKSIRFAEAPAWAASVLQHAPHLRRCRGVPDALHVRLRRHAERLSAALGWCDVMAESRRRAGARPAGQAGAVLGAPAVGVRSGRRRAAGIGGRRSRRARGLSIRWPAPSTTVRPTPGTTRWPNGGVFTVECQRCRQTSHVGVLDLLIFQLPVGHVVPEGRYDRRMTCPSCRRRAWCSVTLRRD